MAAPVKPAAWPALLLLAVAGGAVVALPRLLPDAAPNERRLDDPTDTVAASDQVITPVIDVTRRPAVATAAPTVTAPVVNGEPLLRLARLSATTRTTMHERR